MGAFCLTKDFTDKFLKGLKSGEIDPAKIAEMTSEDRRSYLAKFVGEENGKHVNALFESKLLLKGREQGFINWAKRVGSITTEARRDIVSRVQKMDKILDPKAEEQFLHDLASTRLGIDVTQAEAKNIVDLSKAMQDSKTAWETKLKEEMTKNPKFDWKNDNQRFAYGMDQVNFEKYINDLKLQTRGISFKEQPVRATIDFIKNTPGTLKSLVSSLDNSFFGRQGIKTLLDIRTSPIWLKSFLKSWGDIGREFIGHDAIDLIKADIYSRPNALSGKYRVGKYGLDVLSEEAFPSSLPERIPLLGRLFKASEAAYNGAALRMRADLADRFINLAEKNGVNTLDPKQAEGLGHLVGSLTGRGSIGKFEAVSKEINVLLFSVKFLKSNFDTLTAHQFDSKASSFVKKEAAKSLLSITATVATALTVAKLINPNSVEEDPRSSNFGKINIYGHWVDITGGMASLVTLASRITPTEHNGQWGFWTKSKSGSYTNLLSGKYGQQTPLDVVNSFIEGKLSPALGIVRDAWAGKTYSGQKTSLNTELQNQIPLSVQNFTQLMKDPSKNYASVLSAEILDGLGFSVSINNQATKDWGSNPTKAQQAFLSKVGQANFDKANADYNNKYNEWLNRISQSTSYKNLTDSAKQELTTKAKEDIQMQVFKSNGFVYKQPKQTSSQISQTKTIKGMLPK